MPHAAVILINGFPGVGKGAVAEALAKLLPNARLLDMHQLDVAARGLHQAEPSADSLEYKLVRIELSSLALLTSIQAQPETSSSPPVYILTDTIYTSLPTRSYQDLYLSTAKDSSLPLVHLVISCSTEANIARFTHDGRTHDETDVVENRMIYEIAQFVKPGKVGEGGQRGVAAVPGLAGEYEVDTTTLSPERTAGVFAECISDSLRNEGWFFQLQRVSKADRQKTVQAGQAGQLPAKWA